VRRIHLAAEVAVNPQRSFERDFTGKLDHITDETKPIVLWNVHALVSLSGCRNCLSAHGIYSLCSS